MLDTLLARNDLHTTDEEDAHFKTLLEFQQGDQDGKQLFFNYLSNIESIDVIEGEESLTGFECVSSFYDEYLCHLVQVMDWVQKSE